MVITNNKRKIKKTDHNLSYNGLMGIIHATGWVSYLIINGCRQSWTLEECRIHLIGMESIKMFVFLFNSYTKLTESQKINSTDK